MNFTHCYCVPCIIDRSGIAIHLSILRLNKFLNYEIVTLLDTIIYNHSKRFYIFDKNMVEWEYKYANMVDKFLVIISKVA